MATSLKGHQIAASLPQKPGPAREEAILNLIKEGNALVVWSPIVVDYGDYRATFYVTAEPLMLGDQWDDAFYPGVTASTMQKIADYYNATLLTPKLVDEIWKQAPVRVDPFQGMSGNDEAVARMSDTATFLSHSAIIKKRIASGRDAFKQISFGMQGAVAPIVANIGKYWTVSAYTSNKGKNPYNAIASENYGFFSTAKGARPKSVTLMPNVDVVQTPGHAHDNAHSDYSQVVMLVARSVELCVPQAMAGLGSNYNCKDGGSCQTRNGPGRIKCIDIYDLANDPKLAPMLSHQGTINMRLPSIAYQPPAVCALLALSGIGDYSKPAAAFGESICGTPPPAPGPIGRGPSGGGGSPVPAAGGGVSPAAPPPVPSGGVPRRTHRGDPKAEVEAWQRYLLSQGYDLQPYGADGDHGSKTETASVAWEAARAGRVPAVNGGGGVATANVGGETGDIPATTLLLVGAVGIVAGVLGMSILKK